GTERLDGVERKQGAALGAERANRFDINSKTTDVIRACQRHQAGPFRQRPLNNFRSNLTDSIGLNQDRLDAVSLQAKPRVNVSRVIVKITRDFLPGLPIETIRYRIETTRGWTGQRNFFGLRSQKIR